MRDFQYVRGRVFDLARVGDSVYWQPGDSIIAFKFYFVTDSGHSRLTRATAHLDWVNRASIPDSISGVAAPGEAIVDPAAFRIVCHSWYGWDDARVYAYYMAVKTRTGVREFGDTASLPLKLQMLKPKSLQPSHPLWDAEWKNVYDLGVYDLLGKYSDIRIYKAPFGGDLYHPNSGGERGKSYAALLGLDRVLLFGDSVPDGNIDRNSDLTLTRQGLVAFPDRYPFANPELQDPAHGIYQTTDLATLVAHSKYFISTVVRHIPSQISLGYINLIEGSERVTLNGQALAKGVHYDIDYESGIVVFDSFISNVEGIIRVCYEYAKPEYFQKSR